MAKVLTGFLSPTSASSNDASLFFFVVQNPYMVICVFFVCVLLWWTKNWFAPPADQRNTGKRGSLPGGNSGINARNVDETLFAPRTTHSRGQGIHAQTAAQLTLSGTAEHFSSEAGHGVGSSVKTATESPTQLKRRLRADGVS